MSIAKRVCEAFDRYLESDYEGALIPTCIAIDATASKIHPGKKNNEAYKEWLHDNLPLITKAGMGNISIENYKIGFRHPDIKSDSNGCCTLEQVLYHVVRCGLLHTAALDDTVRFGPPGENKFDGATLVLGASLILGLLAAVVVSPVNTGLNAPVEYGINISGEHKALNDLWGNRQAFLSMFDKLG
jgi:hypothetical protein